MAIRVWRSFSCNNSSSYRLVARFQAAEPARETAEQLTAFLAEATPLGRQRPRGGGTLTTATTFPVTAAIDALAAEHGFDWTGLLVSGVYGVGDDDMMIVTEGATLVVYHPYCLGLGPDLPAYLTACGATVVERELGSAPTVSVLFRLPTSATDRLDKVKSDLTALFAQADETKDTRQWKIKPPWSPDGAMHFASCASISFFCDDKLLGFYLPIEPDEVQHIKTYLREAGVEDASLSIRLCEATDLLRFRAIGKARCSHCDARLEYLEKHEHGIQTDQLACAQCGGMFELEPFL